MRSSKLITLVTASLVVPIWLLGLTTVTAQAQTVSWKRIEGTVQTFDLVGSGTGQVTGAAPWTAKKGNASVKLANGKVKFNVKGLVLAVGNVPGTPFFGLDIGATAGITSVRGTLVCDLDGSAGGGNSTFVDTLGVPLSAQGDAKFSGNFVDPLPPVCSTEPDCAFLIRIDTGDFDGLYIAFGAVRDP